MTAASNDSPTSPVVASDDGRIPGTLQFLRIRDVCQLLRISNPLCGGCADRRTSPHPRS